MVQMQMMNGSYGDTDGLDGGAQAGVILGGALNGVTTMTAFNLQEHTSTEYDKVRFGHFGLCGIYIDVPRISLQSAYVVSSACARLRVCACACGLNFVFFSVVLYVLRLFFGSRGCSK